MSNRIVVTGASGSVGRRVTDALAARDDVGDVVAVDLRSRRGKAPNVISERVDLCRDDLKPVFEDATTIVHLASSFEPRNDGVDTAHVDIDATRRVLDAAGSAGVKRLVLLSSAMVYGAWAANPIPITENAPVRPNPEFSFGVVKAQTEQLAQEWRSTHPETEVVILRPTTALAEGEATWVARSLRAATMIDVEGQDPPLQFLHLDDLADAVVLASQGGLDGPYNVAPDGSVDGETCRELVGRVPRVRLPEEAAEGVGRFRWRHRLAPTPPGITAYTAYPWVVANDRLRAAGWQPRFTNEQAYVDGTPARPWATMNAKRRQQVALGAATVLVLASLVGLGWLVRRLQARK
ncbi:MAG: NAD-dependent epimerase/dehydratase family protein [Actinomycetota bacterium]